MKFIRHTIIAASPFLAGMVIGLAMLPVDSQAAARADFAAISQMSDLQCAKIAQRPLNGFFVPAFQSYRDRIQSKRNCAPQADSQPAAALAPRATYGMARSRFVWGR